MNSQAWWCIPILSATKETEARELKIQGQLVYLSKILSLKQKSKSKQNKKKRKGKEGRDKAQ